jgi:hypothetical protein
MSGAKKAALEECRARIRPLHLKRPRLGVFEEVVCNSL